MTSVATSSGGGAGEIRTREPGTPVTAFPVRTPSGDLPLRVVAPSTSIRLELDFRSSQTPLQRNPVFGNAVAASQEMPRPPGQFLVVLEMALQASVSRRSAKTRRIILLRDRSVQRRVPVNQAELWRPGVVRSRPRRLSG